LFVPPFFLFFLPIGPLEEEKQRKKETKKEKQIERTHKKILKNFGVVWREARPQSLFFSAFTFVPTNPLFCFLCQTFLLFPILPLPFEKKNPSVGRSVCSDKEKPTPKKKKCGK